MKIASLILICSSLNLSAITTYSLNTDRLQQLKVSGKVTDSKTGSGIPGVNIVVKDLFIGTSTDGNGDYSITVPGRDAVLVFTFIGYTSQVVPVNGSSNINIALALDVTALNEVVVTALGIEKRTNTLTYATQKIAGQELLTVKDVNYMNSLTGKIAGAVITPGTMGPGSDTRVLIRGDKSFTGNSAPLYVIDGVPSGRGDLFNPEDIESLQILQGASAAALYGSQSANGVILITTKKGKKGVAKINFSSNVTMEGASDLPKLQTKYGQTDPKFNDSWGAVVTNGSDKAMKEFYKTGVSKINSVSVSNGNDIAQVYFSYANTAASGILPENHMTKDNINLKISTQLFNGKLSIEGAVDLINQKTYNQNSMGGYSAIPGILSFPISDDWSKYSGSNFEVWDPARLMYVQNWPYIRNETFPCQNPLWVQNKNQNDNFFKYFSSSCKATYKIFDWLNLQGRVNSDNTFSSFESRLYASTQLVPNNGAYSMSSSKSSNFYSDLLLAGNKNIGKDINISGTLGFSHRENLGSSVSMSSAVASLTYPNYFSADNIATPFNRAESKIKAVSEALFANATVGYKDKVFLDVTARNEWSSTVSQPFFYPSIGLTYIMKKSDEGLLSFAKVRVSYAEVGNSLPFGIANPNPPYALDASGNVIGHTTLPFFSGNDTIKLKPERTKSYEIGTDLRFFNNKLSLNLTFYSATTVDQVFNIAAPAGAGTQNFWLNGGSIRNQGIEGVVSYNASFGDIKWTPSLTFSRNKNQIRELSNLVKGDWFVITDWNSTRLAALYLLRPKNGHYGSYGDLFGTTYQKDANGKVIVNPTTGLPLAGTTENDYLGNANPDFLAGFNNTFTYKKIRLSFLIDSRFGGNVISRNEEWLDYKGLSKATGDARDAGGVMYNGTRIDAKSWYMNMTGSGGHPILSEYLRSATNIRMRELSLGYTFSNFSKIFESIDISLVGRNLFILYKKAPFDPEIGGSASQTAEGMGNFALPGTRSYGLNLRVNF